MSSSFIGIKKSALKHNLDFLRNHFKDKKLSVVIKGNAYGHGIEEIIPVLENFDVDHFSVFNSFEARRAAESSKKKTTTIMIMGYIHNDDYEWVIHNGIEFFVFELIFLKKAIETAKSLNKKAIIHLELETGMNRTGFTNKELKEVIDVIKKNKDHLNIKGACTHFAGAESIANFVRIKEQAKEFQNKINEIEASGIYPEIKHVSCSASAITYPEYNLDMIRTGILVYGYWPSQETFMHYVRNSTEKRNPLKRAVFWQSEIFSIKTVGKGEFVGYGLSFQATEEINVAIIPVGYADGYTRVLSNTGHVLVKGKSANIIGTVNMNMIIIDISQIKEPIAVGDEVILVGKQGDAEISLFSFAEMNNGLNYELLTRLPVTIPRKISE